MDYTNIVTLLQAQLDLHRSADNNGHIPHHLRLSRLATMIHNNAKARVRDFAAPRIHKLDGMDSVWSWLMMMSCPTIMSKAMNLAFSILNKAGTVVVAVSMIAAKVLVCGAIAVRVLVCEVEAANTTVGTPRASVNGLPVIPATATVALACPTLLPVD
jgi:hypothetical protein